jgi:hypothetical protein
MTVIELIEELKKYPENMQVALYNNMSEDSSLSNELKVHNKQNGPYNKGDDVWDLWRIDKNEELLFIKSD